MPDIPFTRFCLPNGRQEPTRISVSDAAFSAYKKAAALGLRMTVELLTTGEVSMCIEDPKVGDFDCVVCPNGPGVRETLETMMARFAALKDPATALKMWRYSMGEEPEEAGTAGNISEDEDRDPSPFPHTSDRETQP